jgi:actin related protein 2/3 complex subunit 1A/1B
VSVCYFESDNDWWVSKHIKKSFKSTVTCLDWHPNNVLLACGSTDFKARVFSAYIKEVDEKPGPTDWGSRMPFANLMAEFTSAAGGWVHAVSFSMNGSRLAWVSHDSCITVVDAADGLKLTSVKTDCLPFVTLTWVSVDNIVVAGHNCGPVLFSYHPVQGIIFVSRLDEAVSKQQQGPKFSAMKHFQSLDYRAVTVDDSQLDTIHQNTITQVSIYAGHKACCIKLSTSGIDGQLVVWDLKTSLESAIAGLQL